MNDSDSLPDGPVLLTGAAGRVGSAVADGLRPHCRLRLTDRRPLPAKMADRGEFAQGDLRDSAFASEITENAQAIVHLAGDPRAEASWEDAVEANVLATASLLDAAAANGVRRLVYASSVHVAGAYNDPKCWPVSPLWPARPCCRYGVSKAAGELIAESYARTVAGASVVVLRLPLIAETPRWRAEARAWLALPDLVQLLLAALRPEAPSGTYFANSITSRPRYDSGPTTRDLGFVPMIASDVDALPTTPPSYADNCVLWKLPTLEAGGVTHIRSTGG